MPSARLAAALEHAIKEDIMQSNKTFSKNGLIEVIPQFSFRNHFLQRTGGREKNDPRVKP